MPDVHQQLKRRHRAPAGVEQCLTKSLAWSEISINFHLAEQISSLKPILLCEAKDLLLQKQSLQYPIFPSQARDQSFKLGEETREDIGRSRLFQS